MKWMLVMILERDSHFAFDVFESRTLRPVGQEFATSVTSEVLG